MVILIIGPSGSGKGTQAGLLAEKLAVPTISMGELMRMEIAKGSLLGQRAGKYVHRGLWVPAKLTLQVLRPELDKYPGGFVLDGFPRLIEQWDLLEEYLASRGKRIDKMIYLKIGDGEAVRRLLSRVRTDDKREVIEQRLKSFKDTVEPILSRARQLGILEQVDGERSIEAIHQDIMARL